MNITLFKDSLIPELKTFCGVPIIKAEQKGPKPTGPHATFKVTSPYIKGVGQAEENGKETDTSYQLNKVEQFKRVLSFSAYDLDDDVSMELAQKIHDWFDFYGYDFLSSKNIVVVEVANVQNRDVFLFDDYERRNGFDVTLRLTKELVQEFDYIDDLKEFTRIDREYEDQLDAEDDNTSTEQPLTMAGETKAGDNSI